MAHQVQLELRAPGCHQRLNRVEQQVAAAAGAKANSAFSFISLQSGCANGRPMVFSISRSVFSADPLAGRRPRGGLRASVRMSPIDSSRPVFHTRKIG